MNENEINKGNITNSGSSEKSKETVYRDFELLDLDALRKTQKPSENAHKSTQHANAASVPEAKNHLDSPRTPSKVSLQRPKKNIPNKESKVTNIKPDKVVFDSSSSPKKPLFKKKNKQKKEPVEKRVKTYDETSGGSNPIATLSKALIYIASVLLVSFICAYFIIVISNDVFAFVKSDEQVEVVIPEYATLDQIADELYNKQVIKYPKIFVLYTMIRSKDPGKYIAGTYTVSPTQNFDELLSTFVEKKSRSLTEVSVTIPEGYTVDDIIDLFVNEKGIGTREGFIDAIQNGEYDYWFVNELTNTNPNRKYRLEGYLYPDTYYVYKESEETSIINKMLANFHSKFSIEYKQECEKSGMTVDEVINFASLIQMEAKYTTDYSMVSSVFHNRLNSSYYDRKLESCATIQYILPERKERITNDDTLIDNPYNTYRYPGLPPGPISNPTLKAIRAALYPEQSNYYFFVNDIEGNLLFAKTFAEHNANKAKVDAQYENASK